MREKDTIAASFFVLCVGHRPTRAKLKHHFLSWHTELKNTPLFGKQRGTFVYCLNSSTAVYYFIWAQGADWASVYQCKVAETMTHTHTPRWMRLSVWGGGWQGWGALGTPRVGLRLYSQWIFKEATYPVKITLSTGWDFTLGNYH